MESVLSASNKKKFNVVSLFAGGGGSSTGYRLAGGDVLAINEFVESARDTYKSNYPSTHIFEQDIRNLSCDDILKETGLKKFELDVLDGSPPCASFSIAGKKEKLWGKKKKYSDTEQRVDDLFYEYARILNGLQPKVFVAENVKGLTMGKSSNLLGSSQKSMFPSPIEEKTIFETLTDCGYNVRYKVLNAKNYRVPQNRERLFIVGVRNDIKKRFKFPKRKKGLVTLGEALNDVKCIEMNRKAFNEEEPRRVERNGVCFTITADGLGATRRYKVKRFGVNVSQKDRGDSSKDFRNAYDGVSPTILTQYKGLANGLVEVEYGNENVMRKLSIPELKIICSFPIDYKLTGSYSKQWERLGRSVPPLLMKSIAENIYETVLK